MERMFIGANNVSEEGQIVERLFKEQEILWQFGGPEYELRVVCYDDPEGALDLSFYERPGEPTLGYFKKHSITLALEGRNPELKPVAIGLLSSGTLFIEFELINSKRWIDTLFPLNKGRRFSIEEFPRHDLRLDVKSAVINTTGDDIEVTYQVGDRFLHVTYVFS